jgi:hypothetical protein
LDVVLRLQLSQLLSQLIEKRLHPLCQPRFVQKPLLAVLLGYLAHAIQRRQEVALHCGVGFLGIHLQDLETIFQAMGQVAKHRKAHHGRPALDGMSSPQQAIQTGAIQTLGSQAQHPCLQGVEVSLGFVQKLQPNLPLAWVEGSGIRPHAKPPPPP